MKRHKATLINEPMKINSLIVILVFAFHSTLLGREIVFELFDEGSLLSTRPNDSQTETRVFIFGTFKGEFAQGPGGVSLRITEIDFRDQRSEYIISGVGNYSLGATLSFHDGLPGIQFAILRVDINEFKEVIFLTPELSRGISFPFISFGVSAGADGHTLSLRVNAAPRTEDLKRFFRRGDVNADDFIDLSDAISLINILIFGESIPDCSDALDVNDDGEISLDDSMFLLGSLFLGQEQIPKLCGVDPSLHDLDCNGQPVCMDWQERPFFG